MLSSLSFAISITLPIFLVIGLGLVLRLTGGINDAFVGSASKLSFNVALPALLFISIIKAEVDFQQNLALVAYGAAATIVSFILLELLLPRFVKPKADVAVVCQGSFRSNMGIIGLAYCINAYGDSAYGAAALYLALLSMLYNVLSVATLTRWLTEGRGQQSLFIGMSKSLATNPLMLAIFVALFIKLAGIPIAEIFLQAGSYLAQMALPLALLCTGASLQIKAQQSFYWVIIATLLRLIVLPLLTTLGAYWAGFRGMELGIIFLMMSAPTAIASYTMVRAMNGNSPLAANIIACTTFASLVTTAIGMSALRALGLV